MTSDSNKSFYDTPSMEFQAELSCTVMQLPPQKFSKSRLLVEALPLSDDEYEPSGRRPWPLKLADLK